MIIIFRYVQEKIGLHELAPQYRQFYTIFEQFKISDERSNIPPPMLANITSLSSQPKHSLDDDMDEDNEEFEEVSLSVNDDEIIAFDDFNNFFIEKT